MRRHALRAADLALLDELAQALAADNDADIRCLYAADERLRVPAEMIVAGP